MRHISHIVVHHTASTHSTFDSVINWHMTGNGWDRERSGYHYMISKEGIVFESNPITRAVWHCKGHNQESIGISLLGDFMVEPVSGGQMGALRGLLLSLQAEFPNAIVVPHCSLGSTSCPGTNLLTILNAEGLI